MKKIFFLALMTAIIMVSCNQKNKENSTIDSPMMKDSSAMKSSDGNKMMNDSLMMKNTVTMYSCPMHPEVQGKLNDKCPKCGMKLTEPVTETATKSSK
ncbi:heavy metal-binding domain-containing protein [Flavobacterium sp. DSP2-3-1]|uniref:heavy metal-binding domain-containing protein n=1 Tax=Flavobacterium sp. DSP2-3-1 TaxID=2804620 RepID=UPI003CEE5E9E